MLNADEDVKILIRFIPTGDLPPGKPIPELQADFLISPTGTAPHRARFSIICGEFANVKIFL